MCVREKPRQRERERERERGGVVKEQQRPRQNELKVLCMCF